MSAAPGGVAVPEPHSVHDDIVTLRAVLTGRAPAELQAEAPDALRRLVEQLESLRTALTLIKDRDPVELGYIQYVQHIAFEALGGSNPASNPFVVEPMDLGIPVDDEKVAQKIEDRKAVEEGYFRDDYPASSPFPKPKMEELR